MKSNAAFASAEPATWEPERDTQWNRVTYLTNTGPWLTKALRQIGEIAALPEDWDSAGSAAPRSEVVQAAIEMLLHLEHEEPPMPQICPVSGGGIQFEWHGPGREMEIEVLPDSSVQFLTVAENNQTFEAHLPGPDRDAIRALVKWLVQT